MYMKTIIMHSSDGYPVTVIMPVCETEEEERQENEARAQMLREMYEIELEVMTMSQTG